MNKFVPAMLSAAVAAALISLPGLGIAQSSNVAQSPNPVTTAARSSIERSSRIMAEAAEKMPANKYSFQPTPGSRTFGALMLHIGNSNRAFCHWLTGAPAAPRNSLTATSPKAQLVASLKSSFVYCNRAMANFNDSKLGGQVPFFGHRTMSAAAELIAFTGDLADHYSQQAAYLRANGMLPPTAHHGRP